jgi:hypothetical protein
MRTAVMIVAVVCVATVLTELLGLGFLWYRGQLTSTSIAEMRLALSGDDEDSFGIDESEMQDQLSSEDYSRQRVTRILELSTREEELDLLKRVVNDTRQGVIDEQAKFQKKKLNFEEQLNILQETAASEAMEKTRGVLLALQPDDAIDYLMALAAEENIMLLKGMPDKSIARILQTFLAGKENEQTRGQEVFQAISQGNPSKLLIDEALIGLSGDQPVAN